MHPLSISALVTKTLSGEDIDRHVRVRHADNNFNSWHATDEEEDAQHPAWQNIGEDSLLLASPLVYGFSLTDKLWCKLIAYFYPYHLFTP